MITVRYYGRAVDGSDEVLTVDRAIELAKRELKKTPKANDHALIFDGPRLVATVVTLALKTISSGKSPYRIQVKHTRD